MKTLLIIFIIVVGIIFISGCIGGEKAADLKTSTESSSANLINPTTLLNDYLSGAYETSALSKMDSFEAQFDQLFLGEYSRLGQGYEGDIPPGKKRVKTQFMLFKKERKGVGMTIYIFESDSDSNFKKSYSDIEKPIKENNYFIVDRNLIGDYSLLISPSESNSDLSSRLILIFSKKNYLVKIESSCIEKEICRTETLKVAKEINSRLG